METTPYNFAEFSEEKINKHYELSIDCVQSLEAAIVEASVIENPAKIVQACIDHLEALISFNCWESKDISFWYTAIEQGKNYLNSFANE